MNAQDVAEVIEALAGDGATFWIDGGWGIDALVGEQTRAHSDLDLAVAFTSLEDVASRLAALGFVEDEASDPGPPARVVLRDDKGRQIDIHPLIFDEQGNGWQQLSASGSAWGLYPEGDLLAEGTIAGHGVRCLSARLQFRFHLGYEWDENALHDMRLLTQTLKAGPAPPGGLGS